MDINNSIRGDCVFLGVLLNSTSHSFLSSVTVSREGNFSIFPEVTTVFLFDFNSHRRFLSGGSDLHLEDMKSDTKTYWEKNVSTGSKFKTDVDVIGGDNVGVINFGLESALKRVSEMDLGSNSNEDGKTNSDYFPFKNAPYFSNKVTKPSTSESKLVKEGTKGNSGADNLRGLADTADPLKETDDYREDPITEREMEKVIDDWGFLLSSGSGSASSVRNNTFSMDKDMFMLLAKHELAFTHAMEEYLKLTSSMEKHTKLIETEMELQKECKGDADRVEKKEKNKEDGGELDVNTKINDHLHDVVQFERALRGLPIGTGIDDDVKVQVKQLVKDGGDWDSDILKDVSTDKDFENLPVLVSLPLFPAWRKDFDKSANAEGNDVSGASALWHKYQILLGFETAAGTNPWNLVRKVEQQVIWISIELFSF